jgi:hypothetical protein
MSEKWKDSNVALLGSDLDIQQRVKAAKSEKEYIGAGEKVGNIYSTHKRN